MSKDSYYHTEQHYKDEYEQAIARKGKLYAEGYVEGLKDGKSLLNSKLLEYKLTEANALLREMRKTYIFNVDANGAPKAELGDIIKLIDRVNEHLNNEPERV